MRKFIFAIPIVLLISILYLIFVHSNTRYRLTTTDRISNEIVTVDSYLMNDDLLIINIVECDWYGKDDCNGQNMIDGTLNVIPYLSASRDTLRFVEKTESSLIYRCLSSTQECWADELKIALTYTYDSANSVFRRNRVLTLLKEKQYRIGLKVH